MQIEGKELDLEKHYLAPVTYIPNHANGNAGHKDCEPGNIIKFTDAGVFVLYSRSRTTQLTNPDNLVWG